MEFSHTLSESDPLDTTRTRQRSLVHLRRRHGYEIVDLRRMPRLHGGPVPNLGESISSWLYRASGCFCVHPSDLVRAIGYDGPSSALDFGWDRDVVSARLAVLLQTEPARVLPLSYPEHSHLNNQLYVFLTFQFHRAHPVFRWCPHCLLEDEMPYFRYGWRFEFSLYCEKHAVWLKDRCSHCGALIDLSLSGTKSHRRSIPKPITMCMTCDADLREQQSREIDARDLETARALNSAIASRIVSSTFGPEHLRTRNSLPVLHGYLYPMVKVTKSIRPRMLGLRYDIIFGRRWEAIRDVELFDGQREFSI
ncbi:TniQ family protein [Cupriavidus sp. USMAHM13]|uniref:TniQ family protein n=1 Tax=Cupriavidus sp. USMAHM13 TaxID=1389192 RepID=UPI0009F50A83